MQKTITPINNTLYLERSYPSSSEIDQKIEISSKAFKQWSQTSIPERIKVINKFIENLLNLTEEVKKEICWQIGRPISQCGSELRGFEERSRYMVEVAEECLADVKARNNDEFDNYIFKAPLGVIFIMAPWNYPVMTATNTIVPALLSGNSVILKHSSQTPMCAELINKALDGTGIPEGLFQYIHTDHTTCEKIISDTRIAHVVFTGSVNGGKQIKKYIGQRFINVGLELGGKDPAYVRADCDLNHAIENLIDGAFFNSGQSCCGIERIYVDKSIFKDFVDGAKSLTEKYVLGDPSKTNTNLGPVVKLSAANFIRSQLDEAISQGANKVVDETKFDIASQDSCYIAPQILVNVNHDMRFMTEETFGPTVGIMSVESESEAINLMNDSPYGLTASIWTKDLEFSKNFGRKIETGTFFMNRCDALDPALAWTGVKDTGVGCSLSKFAFDHLTRPQSFHMRKLS
ncbi:aldehyde dehydrogenase family protein [Alphaproteobacteria bacterium]|jgi:acyl-CoA reductase-like NAD-dependent aldehyde dehydrogenase|nr:aldehyde dehydrogenase family protein [Alphaproteobacteria bacterium]|tara:strand:+ start:2020 stop:3402 length:1383 start_codon:yes stop_codon:yes gene_type:complete